VLERCGFAVTGEEPGAGVRVLLLRLD
jgi:hypothetical protein